MHPDTDPRQSRRTPYPHEFILILFRITERTPGEAELNPELTARSASKHFPRSASALPCKPERIHQPGTRTCPGSTRQLHQRSVRTLASPYSTSAAADEASIASGLLTAQQLEDLTRKWVRLMRESRDMLHHESSIAAARAAVEAKPLPE